MEVENLKKMCMHYMPINNHSTVCDISCTDAEVIPKSIQNCNELEELNANNNMIKVLEGSIFCEFKNLKKLSLENNMIYNIHKNAFDGLNYLHELNLKNNYLKEINLGTFHILGELKTLWLQNNFVKNLNSSFFENNTKLEDLQISIDQVLVLNLTNTTRTNDKSSPDIFEVMFQDHLSKTAECNARTQSIITYLTKSCLNNVNVLAPRVLESNTIHSDDKNPMSSNLSSIFKNFSKLELILLGVIACCLIVMIVAVIVAFKSKTIVTGQIDDKSVVSEVELRNRESLETIFNDPSEMQPFEITGRKPIYTLNCILE